MDHQLRPPPIPERTDLHGPYVAAHLDAATLADLVAHYDGRRTAPHGCMGPACATCGTPGARPCIPPPADELMGLVRYDLANTARAHKLRALARLIAIASTPEEWFDVAADFDDADIGGGHRYDVRAASDAAMQIAYGDTWAAIAALAEVCDVDMSVDEWVVVTRAESAEGRS